MGARRNSLPRLLAGLQVGILGGLVSIVWFLILSTLYFRAPWSLINLFSASLRDSATWGHGFSKLTFTGLAAHIFACGLVGMLVGWLVPRPLGNARISFAALVFGIVISLMVYEFLWRRLVPLLSEYIPATSVLMVHLLIGLSLAQFPKFICRLSPPAPAQPENQEDAGQARAEESS
jgi:cytochrome b561